MARRPRQIPAREPLTAEAVAAATYVGSPEHKTSRYWGGLPQGWADAEGRATRPKKQNTTICPLITREDRDRATDWLRTALARGQYRFLDADKVYPARVWHRDERGRLWMAFCINSVLGEYKGWPIEEEERLAIFG